MATSLPVDEEARNSLRLYKWISGSRDYSEAIVGLMREAGYEVPDGGLSREDLMERVFGR